MNQTPRRAPGFALVMLAKTCAIELRMATREALALMAGTARTPVRVTPEALPAHRKPTYRAPRFTTYRAKRFHVVKVRAKNRPNVYRPIGWDEPQGPGARGREEAAKFAKMSCLVPGIERTLTTAECRQVWQSLDTETCRSLLLAAMLDGRLTPNTK